MAEMTQRRGGVGPRSWTRAGEADHTAQAYWLLQLGFVLAPTIAGVDKFFHVLVNWDQYLAPPIARALPFSGHRFMLVAGVVEMAAGLLVALRPRIGAYVVAAWLAGIVINLLVGGKYFDIALRDFGLMLGALALGRLSEDVEPARRRRLTTTG